MYARTIRRILLPLLLIVHINFVVSTVTPCLIPDAKRTTTTLSYVPFERDGSGIALLCITNLTKGSAYEVHISKPAWVPAIIRQAVGVDATGAAAAARAAPESEKLTLKGHGGVEEIVTLAIYLERRGPAAVPQEGVSFHVRVDPLLWEAAIPQSAVEGLLLPILLSIGMLLILVTLVIVVGWREEHRGNKGKNIKYKDY